MADPLHIVLVGGGVSSACTCVALCRHARATQRRVRITAFEPRAASDASVMWCGPAYSATCEWHLLNIPHQQMSMIEDDRAHLSRYVETHEAHRVGDGKPNHVPRRVFGDYIKRTVAEETAAADGFATVDVVPEAIVAVHYADRTALSAAGVSYRFDAIVLATGNADPADPGVTAAATEEERVRTSNFYAMNPRCYVRNTWDRLRGSEVAPLCPDPDATVAIVGSRLTAVDVLLSLHHTGHRGPVHILSREGLLPTSNDFEHPVPPYPVDLLHDVVAALPPVGPTETRVATVHVAAIAARLRAEAKTPRDGLPWQAVVHNIRPHENTLWAAMDDTSRAQFLREFRSEWEIYRHRVAPDVFATLQTLLADTARVVNHKQGLRCVEVLHDGRAHLQCGDGAVVDADVVFNCTGPNQDFRRPGPGVYESLLQQGVVWPEPHGLGLFVNRDTGEALKPPTGAAAPGALAEAARGVYLQGAVRRGSEWECIAVADIRKAADAIAAHILRRAD